MNEVSIEECSQVLYRECCNTPSEKISQLYLLLVAEIEEPHEFQNSGTGYAQEGPGLTDIPQVACRLTPRSPELAC